MNQIVNEVCSACGHQWADHEGSIGPCEDGDCACLGALEIWCLNCSHLMSWHASGGACIAVHDNGRVCPCFGASKAVADELVSRNPKPEYWCVNCEKGWEEHDDDNCKWTVYLRPPVE